MAIKSALDFTRWFGERLPGEREFMIELRVMTVFEKDEDSCESEIQVISGDAVFRSWETAWLTQASWVMLTLIPET